MKNKKWKEFALSDIFTTIQRGKRLVKGKQLSGNIPYISSSMKSNGIDGFIGNEKGIRKFNNCLTIANSGSVGSVFYHDYEFISSDHVTALLNEEWTREQYLFVGTCLKQIGGKYSFNREISDKRIKMEKILLPIKDDETPDWDFMEEYIRNKTKQINSVYNPNRLHEIHDYRELSDIDWKGFTIDSLGKITGGKDWEAYNRSTGYSPFIGSSSINNGVTDFVNFVGREKHVGKGVLGINRNGSVGYAFYHPYEAYFSGDTRFIEIKNYKGNKFINQFVATMIVKQKEKYAFGYKMGTERIKKQIIMLPTKDGQPDFDFMEQYMKRMENKILAKLPRGSQFECTTDFIYQQTAKRLKTRKKQLLLTNYQVAGFKNQKEYNDSPNYNKVDDNLLSMILNNKRNDEKNLYLIPSRNADLYYQIFLENLKFDSVHDILWGHTSEIQVYLPLLFQNIFLDSLQSSNEKIKNICSSLIECHIEKNIEDKIAKIYEEIKEPFLKEFLDFTKAKVSKEPLRNAQSVEYKIVNSKGSNSIIDETKANEILGTKINEYLGYQKLNKSLENFIENRLIPLFVGNLIGQFNYQEEIEI